MKLLMFQAPRFAWEPFSKTLDDAAVDPKPRAVDDALVLFVHAEEKDVDPDERKRVFKHALKHAKWLANKRSLKSVVLHSFTHLSESTAPAPFAEAFLVELARRLQATGYHVHLTPFGWFCSWTLSVHGESLAKVFKAF